MLWEPLFCPDSIGTTTLLGHIFSKQLDRSQDLYLPRSIISSHLPNTGDYAAMHNLPTPSTTPQGADDTSPTPTSMCPSETKARLRKACDSCSIRKVKCDEEGPPCRACASLDIPCTFERPSRRRGPPNRHAEAIKKRRLESPGLGSMQSSPNSPSHAAHTLASFAKQQVLSSESICPLELLDFLVDDYFAYIHPLIPIPHEPSFRDALQRREDLTSPTFLSLLSAMIGALVVSFPRKPRQHLKTLRKEHLFPNSASLIDRCHKVSVEARGAGFLDKHLTVYDAATSYLLAITSAYSFKWRQCKLYFGESLTILRTLGVYKSVELSRIPNETHSTTHYENREPQRDYITQEMGRRTFWILYVGVKTLHQLGASFTEVFIPPPTQTSPYPPLPMEVDDFCIYSDNVATQPLGVISEIAGLNANIRTFQSYDQLNIVDITYGSNNCVDWEHQRQVVEHCLVACKRALEGVPRELMLITGSPSVKYSSGLYSGSSNYNRVLSHEYIRHREGTGPLPAQAEKSPQERRKIQYEIQKANIYVTQLGTRSHIVEKYWARCEQNQSRKSPSHSNNSLEHNSVGQNSGVLPSNIGADLRHQPLRSQHSGQTLHIPVDSLGQSISNQPLPVFQRGEMDIATEREEIVRDLLTVLRSIDQTYMEPNGAGLVHKIRLIASTLLEVPRTRKGAFVVGVEQYLATFLDVLVKLEHGPVARDGDHIMHNNEAGGIASTDAIRSGLGGGYQDASGRFQANLDNNVPMDHMHGHHIGVVNGLPQYTQMNAGSSASTELDPDEEAELRHWADLREYQNHFTKASDLMADL